MKPNRPYRVDFDAIKRMPFETLAADWGYARDAAASTRASPVLSGPGLPKLVTRREDNGHWVYFNTRDNDDNGTAIDFMLRRGLSFADICDRFGPPGPDVATDFASRWRDAIPHPAPEWLVKRGIRRETLDTYRPLIRCDRNGRVLFAHRDQCRELTGFEIGPPDGRRRFATGGTRSLFALHAGTERLQAIVVTEGAVNALSLAQISRCPTAHAFLSTAGAPSNRQCAQIGLAAHRLARLETVILAQDNDEAGEQQAETLRQKVTLPTSVTFKRHRPPANVDWNDIVNAGQAGQDGASQSMAERYRL